MTRLPACYNCKHLSRGGALGAQRTCAAFPSGIPDEIWEMKNAHMELFGGETDGLTWEPTVKGDENPLDPGTIPDLEDLTPQEEE